MKDKKGCAYVPIYLDWLEVTQDLTAEEKGNLIDAVIAYASDIEYEHLLTGAVRICFRFLKGQVDRNKEISEIRRKARQDKDEQPESDDDKKEQNGTNGNKTEQNGTKSPKEKEKEEEEKEKDKKRFDPPTLEQVTDYIREIGADIDPQYFLDYQEARNWVLSNGKKAKDWKAVIRTWAHNNFRKPQQQPSRSVVAQQYTQRDYEDEDAEAFRRMLAMETG